MILLAVRRTILYLTTLQFFIRDGLANVCSDTGTSQVLHLNVTCDRFLDVYIDGQHVGNSTYPSVSKLDIGIGSNIIAIRCKGTKQSGWIGNIIASLSNGIVTDKTWKCKTSYENGWNMRNFDELGWSSPVEHETNNPDAIPFGQRQDIAANAKYIWSKHLFGDMEFYCRKPLVTPCNEQRFRYFASTEEWINKALAGSALKKISVSSTTECGLNCLNTPQCASFNYEIVEKNKRLCELFQKRGVSTKELLSRPGFQYFEIIKTGY